MLHAEALLLRGHIADVREVVPAVQLVLLAEEVSLKLRVGRPEELVIQALDLIANALRGETAALAREEER